MAIWNETVISLFYKYIVRLEANYGDSKKWSAIQVNVP